MRKKLALATIILILCSTFSMLAPEAKAEGDDALVASFLWQGHGGYVAGGTGMWLQGGASASGDITISGIPDGASIEAAFLYWCTWEEIDPPSTSIMVNGISITEEVIGTVTEIDPLWPAGQWPHTYRGYRADISSIIIGNGIYEVSGFPTGTEYDRQNTMGASIVVIYSLVTEPEVTIIINDGMVALHARPQSYTTSVSGFVAPPSPIAKITFIAGQAEPHWNLDWEYFNGNLLAQNGLDGSDGPLWDTDTYDVSSYILEGDTSATVTVSMENDWIGWVAAILQVTISPVAPDLTILDVKPIQVIWDCDINDDNRIDLVSGKPTVAITTIEIDGTLEEQEVVDVELTFNGAKQAQSYTVKELLETEGVVEFYFTPKPVGDYKITVEVDPYDKITESNENNNEKSIEVTIKETGYLYLTYVPVYAHRLLPWGADPPWGYGPLDMAEYTDTVENGGDFVYNTYPLSKDKVANKKRDEKYYGSPVPLFGMLDDAIILYIWGKLLEPSTDRVVGIVPDDYFAFHGRANAAGKAFSGISGVLVREGYWTTTAHEVGHLYGLPAGIHLPLCIPGEEYDATSGREASGFWVEGHKTVESSVCFMGTSPYHFFKVETNYFGRWICDECYEHLFKEFRIDKKDPEILLVNGIIFKNDTIRLGKWYWLPEGAVEYVFPGNYSIQILGPDGTIVSATAFAAPFATYEDPIGVVETNVTGFAFAIPYPDTASTIRIQYYGQTIITLNPNTKLLHDVIDCIPDHGFLDDPERKGRRKALHNKIDAIEEMLAENELIGARNKLEFDIKDKLQKWLVDGYEKTDPMQLSKDEVLALVDEMIDRLNIQIAQRVGVTQMPYYD